MEVVHYFYVRRSSDGRECCYEVPDEMLRTFGLKFGMIDEGHAENMRQLVDPLKPGKRHLNGIQPFDKLVWVRPWRKSAEKFVHSRPRPTNAPDQQGDFIQRLNAEGNGDKTRITNKSAFGKFLNGTYYPDGKAKGPAEQYRQWELAFVTVEMAIADRLLDFCPPS